MSLKWSSQFQLWEPSELGADLALWLDADDADTLTLNGSNVAQWDDKSGNGRNVVQATSALQPVYGSNAINGKPALIFDGDDDKMSTTVGNIFSTTDGGKSILSVIRYKDTTTGTQNVYMTDLAANTPRMYLQANAGTLRAYNGTYLTDGTYTAGQIDLSSLVQLSSGTFLLYRDGTLAGTGVPPTAAATSGFLIADSNTTFGSNADIDTAEFVVFDGDIDDTDRQKIEGYLAHKWGLVANLPSNHPYKAAPPAPGV